MITWEFPPRIVGGISRHCFGLARALVKRGVEVSVLTLDFPGSPLYEEVEGIKIYRVATELGHPDFVTWTFLFNHFMEKKIAELNTQNSFDVIHIHDWLTAPVGIASKFYLKKPLVSTLHSTELGRTQGLTHHSSFMIDGLEWWTAFESKKVIVTSNSMKFELKNHYDLPLEKIEVIPNAIDGTKYEKKVDQIKVKKRYGVASNERIVLFVGRLTPQKGVQYLIKAIPLILSQNSDVKFVISGDGWEKDYLQKLSFTTGCADKVFFTGFLSDSDLIDLTNSSDVLVVPSVYEPFGIVALEGMAAGVPIVTSDVGGLTEIVEHERTGVLVYPQNPSSLSWGVNRVLSDKDFSRWIVKNAKNKIQKIYSWDAVAVKTIKVFEKSCERGCLL
jgi:glycosyltransferase involved in cell wall biosynthesis